mgnify:CR=1 FL=1
MVDLVVYTFALILAAIGVAVIVAAMIATVWGVVLVVKALGFIGSIKPPRTPYP